MRRERARCLGWLDHSLGAAIAAWEGLNLSAQHTKGTTHAPADRLSKRIARATMRNSTERRASAERRGEPLTGLSGFESLASTAYLIARHHHRLLLQLLLGMADAGKPNR